MKFIKLTQIYRKYEYVKEADGITSKRTCTETLATVHVNPERIAYMERKKSRTEGQQPYTDVTFSVSGEDNCLSLDLVETPEEIMARFS